MLDESPPGLKSLQIDGTLVFEDKDLDLEADWIIVHGKLRIGTEEMPFENRATITLTGDDSTENVMSMGTKVLGVMGGTLDLHGESRPGWPRLNATAEKGSNELTLEDASGLRAGDEIVLASTDYDQSQDEDFTITAVSGNTVTLDHPLERQHWGETQTFDGGTVDERAEVALLSRNVTVEGEEASSASGSGGQIMLIFGQNATPLTA